MKRCPHCSFLYLDSDQLCDLDQTPLVADDSRTDVDLIKQPDGKAGTISLTTAVHERKLNPKTLAAATAAGLIIGLMLLLSYQRMRPTLQASQASPGSQAQISHASRVSQVAYQVLKEVSTSAAVPQPESDLLGERDDNVTSSIKPTSSTAVRTTHNTPSDSARHRVSSNPVSTGDVAKPGRGPVTIRLANGSTLEADEVWRTKAGIWYRRKGIVTFLKPNRVRAVNN